MARKHRNNGMELEARAQRLSLAQGVFAERSLVPAASDDHRLLATDIDVLTSEYHANFHVTRGHYECKSGKTQTLDRVLWLAGVRALLDADASYLVVTSADSEAIRFARGLSVDILLSRELAELEQALQIPKECWPCRSKFGVYEQGKTAWRSRYNDVNANDGWVLLKQCVRFVDVESWQAFDYRRLNRLLRCVSEVGELVNNSADDDVMLCSRYLLGSLAVRLTQYLIAICRDVSGLDATDRAEYLRTKLAFGENSPSYATGLINGALRLAGEHMRGDLSGLVDTLRLTSPPHHADDFVRMVEEFRTSPDAARFAPLAMEVSHFDNQQDVEQLSSLMYAREQGRALTALIIGFFIRSLHVPSEALSSCADAIETRYASG